MNILWLNINLTKGIDKYEKNIGFTLLVIEASIRSKHMVLYLLVKEGCMVWEFGNTKVKL
ncbi:MAG: hypothetical protein IKV03_00605 [Alphaproteobacteria bacterium]|nr:hypothetical protein [Alphaproteobacteria bacterium]